MLRDADGGWLGLSWLSFFEQRSLERYEFKSKNQLSEFAQSVAIPTLMTVEDIVLLFD
jgi:hypothetical protein